MTDKDRPQNLELTNFLQCFEDEAEERGFQPTQLVTTSAGEVTAWEKKGRGAVIYFSAGMHGDEPAGPLALLNLLQEDFFSDEFHWLICPALNPEGLVDGTRGNRQEIDLNRDYFRQETDEVSSHIRWLQSCPTIDLFISLHEDWEAEGFYFYEISKGEDRPDRKEAILNAVGEYFEPEGGFDIDGHEPREPGWIDHSDDADEPDEWPEAIWLAKNGCDRSFTFETPSSADLGDRVAAHVAGVRALVTNFSEDDI